jgi:hypothetical protein
MATPFPRAIKEFESANVTVAKVWEKWDIQPWRVHTFKFSTNPELEVKEFAYGSTRLVESRRCGLNYLRLD